VYTIHGGIILSFLLLLHCGLPRVYAARIVQPKATVGIGYIENRDSRYSPYAGSNFISMLEFELIESGYTIIRPKIADPKTQHASTASAVAKKTESAQKSPTDTSDLLPERMRHVAGEQKPQPSHNRKSGTPESFVSAQEIAAMGEQFDYYLEGAVSKTETGQLLEIKEGSMIFIHLYDRNGKRLGAINFTSSKANILEPTFMKKVCRSIIQALDRELLRGAE